MFAPASARKLATAATIPCRSGQETISRATSVGGPLGSGTAALALGERRGRPGVRARLVAGGGVPQSVVAQACARRAARSLQRDEGVRGGGRVGDSVRSFGQELRRLWRRQPSR